MFCLNPLHTWNVCLEFLSTVYIPKRNSCIMSFICQTWSQVTILHKLEKNNKVFQSNVNSLAFRMNGLDREQIWTCGGEGEGEGGGPVTTKLIWFEHVCRPGPCTHRGYGIFSDYFILLLFTCACVEGHIHVGRHLEKERQNFFIDVYFLCK